MQPLVIDVRFPISYILFKYRIFLSEYFPCYIIGIIETLWIFIIERNSFLKNIVVKKYSGLFR